MTELEVGHAHDAADNGWGSRCYQYIEDFQKKFAAYLGVPYAIATSSCTGALHMGLVALSIGAGDEVIIADINWIASASAITYTGATPVFVDVDPINWCISPEAVECAITAKTKAIVATHLYGNMCDMAALQALCDRYGLTLIEDAAEALGSSYHGKKAGGIGKLGVFSFHGTKTLCTGEGGMLVTHDQHIYETVLTLNSHGRSPTSTRQFWAERIGFKYKMSNIQAALGCAQIERINELVARKREIFFYYKEALSCLPLRMNPEPEGVWNSYWMPTIVANSDVAFNRQTLLDTFKKDSIDGRIFFWPLTMLPMFNPQFKGSNPVSYGLSERGINLPSYHDLTTAQQDRVIKAVLSVF